MAMPDPESEKYWEYMEESVNWDLCQEHSEPDAIQLARKLGPGLHHFGHIPPAVLGMPPSAGGRGTFAAPQMDLLGILLLRN